MNDTHEMILETTHSSGSEEWFCPVCGRRFIVNWQPYKRVILEEGNYTASHSGNRGLTIGEITVDDGPGLDLSALEQFIEEMDMRGLD